MSGGEGAPVGTCDRQGSVDLRGPAVSVIVPTCGRHALLARALSSVLRQSYQDWECVVVNDAPAARAEVDALLLELDDRRMTAYHNEVNQGVAAARNAGILHTTGRYLVFLDDDDYWLSDHLSDVFRAHETSGTPIVVYTDFIQQWEDDIVAPRLTVAQSPPEDPTRDLLRGTYGIVTMSTVSFPRSCVDDIGPFDPHLKAAQDWEFYLRASARYRFVRLARFSVVYFHHFANRLTSDYQTRLASLDIIINKWHLDALFLQNTVRSWQYMALDDMIYASSREDWVGKMKALRYFFSFPTPLGSPVLLAKILAIGILPFWLYSGVVRFWHRHREAAARDLLDAATVSVPGHRPRLPGDAGASPDHS